MVVLMLLGWQTEPIDVSSTVSPMQNAFYFWKSLEVKEKNKISWYSLSDALFLSVLDA